jgi:F-type H+-transporting ATPase subunit delta
LATKAYPKRYARAIFEIALENNELDRWQTDLGRLSILSEDPVLLTLLESPKLSFEDKTKMIDERLTGVSPLTHNLVLLLVVRGKMSLIKDITKQYSHLLDSYRGIEHAEVTTAVPLEAADKEKLEKVLSSIIGKKMVVETRVDPSIIGGLVARIDGKLLEGSIHGTLMELKRELIGSER